MTTAAIVFPGPRAGLLKPTRSSGRSESALTLVEIQEEIRQHLLASISMRTSTEAALDELEAVKADAAEEGWNGYAGKPIQYASYLRARDFLQALPTALPQPEVTVAGDGEVAFDWIFRPGAALTVTFGGNGRLTFALMNGHRSYTGTEWLDDGIPATIAEAVSQLARQSSRIAAER